MDERISYVGITFDDVLLEPGYSAVVPADVDVRSRLTRRIELNIPPLELPHGYGHRKQYGDRPGPGGRAWRNP